jgi:hypothetical protein
MIDAPLQTAEPWRVYNQISHGEVSARNVVTNYGERDNRPCHLYLVYMSTCGFSIFHSVSIIYRLIDSTYGKR